MFDDTIFEFGPALFAVRFRLIEYFEAEQFFSVQIFHGSEIDELLAHE